MKRYDICGLGNAIVDIFLQIQDDEFDGNRWNDCHYTNEFKKKAREADKSR